MTDNWINEAFKKAGLEAEKYSEVSALVSRHLDEKTQELLNIWGRVIGDKATKKMLLALIDGDIENALIELSKHFFIGGYLSALDDVKAHKIEI